MISKIKFAEQWHELQRRMQNLRYELQQSTKSKKIYIYNIQADYKS